METTIFRSDQTCKDALDMFACDISTNWKDDYLEMIEAAIAGLCFIAFTICILVSARLSSKSNDFGKSDDSKAISAMACLLLTIMGMTLAFAVDELTIASSNSLNDFIDGTEYYVTTYGDLCNLTNSELEISNNFNDLKQELTLNGWMQLGNGLFDFVFIFYGLGILCIAKICSCHIDFDTWFIDIPSFLKLIQLIFLFGVDLWTILLYYNGFAAQYDDIC